jgi:sugar phosphate permease
MAQKKNINDFGKKGWGIIIYTLFLFWISASSVDLLNVSVDAFAGIKQWDRNTLLIFSAIGLWLTIAVAIIVGAWVVKKGIKIPTITMLIIMGVFYILNGFAVSVPMYGITVVLLTASSGVVNLVSTNTYMSNWFPRKKGIALGWSSMGMCVSSAVSIPLFAILLEKTHTLSVSYGVFGVGAIVIALVTIFGVKSFPEETGAFPDNEPENMDKLEADKKAIAAYKSDWTAGRLLRSKQVWFVSLGFGFLFIALMGTMTQFVPRFMVSGFTQSEAIMWLSVTGVLGIIGSYLWGYLDQKTNTKITVVIYAIYMMAMQFLSAAFFFNRAVSIVLIILIGILIGGIGNLFPSMIIQIFGRYDFKNANGVCVPILTAVRACTFIIIAVVLGATAGDYRILCVVLGFISLVAVLFTLGLSNKTIGRTEL